MTQSVSLLLGVFKIGRLEEVVMGLSNCSPMGDAPGQPPTLNLIGSNHAFL